MCSNANHFLGNLPCDPALHILCGPSIKYTDIQREFEDYPTTFADIWRGSILIVTKDSRSTYTPVPTLRIFHQPIDMMPPPPSYLRTGDLLEPEYLDPIAGATKTGKDGRYLYVQPIHEMESRLATAGTRDDVANDGDVLFDTSRYHVDYSKERAYPTAEPLNSRIRPSDGEFLGKFKDVPGVRLHADSERDATFWRFSFEIELAPKQKRIGYRINGCSCNAFWVPAKNTLMNTMYYTGNGFSMSATAEDRKAFGGKDPLWRDVLNNHQFTPFHVMLGGGNQIYNDHAADGEGVFQRWMSLLAKASSPANIQHPVTDELRKELNDFFFTQYINVFSKGLYSMACSSIPMLNMWHFQEIYPGYGDYPRPIMRTPVFSEYGTTAYKYYLLFQHHTVPHEAASDEKTWIGGSLASPYIKERSRNVLTSLGGGNVLLAIDTITERSVCLFSCSWLAWHLQLR